MGTIKRLGDKSYTQDANGDWYEVESPVQKEPVTSKVLNGVIYHKDDEGNWYEGGKVPEKKNAGQPSKIGGQEKETNGEVPSQSQLPSKFQEDKTKTRQQVAKEDLESQFPFLTEKIKINQPGDIMTGQQREQMAASKLKSDKLEDYRTKELPKAAAAEKQKAKQTSLKPEIGEQFNPIDFITSDIYNYSGGKSLNTDPKIPSQDKFKQLNSFFGNDATNATSYIENRIKKVDDEIKQINQNPQLWRALNQGKSDLQQIEKLKDYKLKLGAAANKIATNYTAWLYPDASLEEKGNIKRKLSGDKSVYDEIAFKEKGIPLTDEQKFHNEKQGIDVERERLEEDYRNVPADQRDDVYYQRLAQLNNMDATLINKFPDYKKSQVGMMIAQLAANDKNIKTSSRIGFISPDLDKETIDYLNTKYNIPKEDLKGITYGNIPSLSIRDIPSKTVVNEASKLLSGLTRFGGTMIGIDPDRLSYVTDKISNIGNYVYGDNPYEKTSHPQTIIDINPTSSTYLQSIPNPKAGKSNYNFTTVSNQILEGAAQFAAFMGGVNLAGAGVKGAAELAGAALTEKAEQSAAMSAYMIASNYENNWQKANQVLGKDSSEAGKAMYATISGYIDKLAFDVLPKDKLFLTNEAKKTIESELSPYLKNLTIKDINKEVIQTKLQKAITGIVNTAKEVGHITAATDAGIISKGIINSIFGEEEPKKYMEDAWQEVKHNMVDTPLSMALPLGIMELVKYQQHSSFFKENIYNAGLNPNKYLSLIQQELAKGNMTQEEANSRMEAIKVMHNIVQSTPDVNPKTNQPFTHNQQVEYAYNRLKESALRAKALEHAEDPAIASIYLTDAQDLADVRKAMIDSITKKQMEEKAVVPEKKIEEVVPKQELEQTQSVIDRVNKNESINVDEIEAARAALYDALDKNPEAANLIEPLIQKLESHENLTKTETVKTTEREPIEGTTAAKRRIEIKPALEQSTGSTARVTLADGTTKEGTLEVEGGNYVIKSEGEEPTIIGEKAMTDRDLKLPEEGDPIELDENGNVKSATFETKDGHKVTITDPEKALDLGIQLHLETVGEIPDVAFDRVYEDVVKEDKVEVPVEKPKKVKAEVPEQKEPEVEQKQRQETQSKLSGLTDDKFNEVKNKAGYGARESVTDEKLANDYHDALKVPEPERTEKQNKIVNAVNEALGTKKRGKVAKGAKGKAALFVAKHIEEPTIEEEVKPEPSKKGEPVGAVPTQTHTVETIDKTDTTGFNEVQKKNISDAKRVLQAITKLVGKDIGKKLKLVVHSTRESAAKAAYDSTIKSGGTEAEARENMQNQGNRGWWSSTDGEIHLNMAEVSSETAMHEGVHPILDAISKVRPEVIDQFHKQLEALPEGKEITALAEENYANYDSTGKISNPQTVKIEAITDYIAKVADGQIKIDRSNFERVRDYIVNLLNKLGLMPEKDIKSIDDLRKLAQMVSEKFAKGEEIRTEKLKKNRFISREKLFFSKGDELSPEEKDYKSAIKVIKENRESFNKNPEAVTPEPQLDKNGNPKIIVTQGENPGDRDVQIVYKNVPYNLENGALKYISKNRQKAIDKLSDDLVNDYNENKDRPEISAAIGWYGKMRSWFQKNFGANIELFGQLLAATSARTEVVDNFKQAVDAMRNLAKGKYDDLLNDYDKYVKSIKSLSSEELKDKWQKDNPTKKPSQFNADDYRRYLINKYENVPLRSNGKKFNANSKKVLQALYGNWIEQTEGPKTKNFAGNLTGRSFEATIDVWAARYLRRKIYEGNTKKWRVLPQSEGGVQFGKLKSGEMTGDYPFAEEVMRSASDKLGIKADDLQAFLWYLEKDVWDKNNWTNITGKKKASFEEAATAISSDRYQAAVTTFRDKGTFDPSKFEEERKSIEKEIANIPGVISSRVNASEGEFVSPTEIFTEPTFDVEFTVEKDADITNVINKVHEIQDKYSQDSTIISKFVDATHPNARPIIEVGLSSPTETSEIIKDIIKTLSDLDVRGFTIAKDRQGKILGIRSQFVPEFEPDVSIEDGIERFVKGFEAIKEKYGENKEISYLSTDFVDSKVKQKENERKQIEQDGGIGSEKQSIQGELPEQKSGQTEGVGNIPEESRRQLEEQRYRAGYGLAGEPEIPTTRLKEKESDTENIPRVSSEIGIGKEPITTEPIKGAGAEETGAGGVLQAPRAEGEGKKDVLFSKKKEEVKGTLDGKPATFIKLPENVEVVNGFYSPIEKRLAETKIDKQSANKWREIVGKGDEAKFTGVLGWLESLPPTQQVSKSEIQNWMKDNRIEINEVVKSSDEVKRDNDKIYEDIDYAIYQNDLYDTAAPDFLEEWRENPTDYRWEQLGIALDRYGLDIDDYVDKKKKPAGKPKYEPYQLPGEATNYKEVLITLPNNEVDRLREEMNKKYPEWANSGKHFEDVFNEEDTNKFREVLDKNINKRFQSSHYDEPNILAHIRMNTRVDAEGNKVTHIEEFQSDWGKAGRTEGFEDIEKQNLAAKKQSLINQYENLDELKGDKRTLDVIKNMDNIRNDIRDINKKLGLKEDDYRTVPIVGAGVSQAPFVTKTADWTKLAWKVALKEAVKEGADKITWTTGEQQNERYDLRKQVDEVNYYKTEDGKYHITADKDGQSISSGIYKENELEGILGKEVAKKIIDNEGEDVDKYNSVFGYDEFGGNQKYKSLKGENLAVGGKGMLGFYGSPSEGKLGIVGEVAKSLFKQEPKTTELKTSEFSAGYRKIKDTEGIKESSKKGYRFVYEDKDISKQKAYEIIEKGGEVKAFLPDITSSQHSIDITPEMKAQVEAGLPMFSKTRNQKVSDMKDILKEYVDEGKSLEEIKNIMKDEFGDYYKDVEGIIEQAHQEMTTTGIKNVVTERERAERGLGEVEVEAKRSFGKVFDDAKEMIANGDANGLTLAAEIIKNPRPLKAEESAVLLIDRMRISNEYNKKNAELLEAQKNGETDKADIIQSQMEALEQEMDLNDEAARKSGYEQGLGLAARRMLIAQDYSLVTQMNRLKAANGGKEVPKQYQEQLKTLITQLEEANKKLEKLEKTQAGTEKQKQVSKIKPVSRTSEQTQEAKKNIKTKIISKWGQTLARMKAVAGIKRSVSPTPITPEKQAQLESIVKDVNDMVKLYAEGGEIELKNIINNIHKDLAGEIPDISKSDIEDIILGKYDTQKVKTPLTKEKLEAQANVRKVKTQIDLLKEELKNKQRGLAEKGVDYLHGWHRFAILSGIPSVAKIGTAALSRGIVTRAENIVGQALSLIPGIRKIAKQAPREGGISASAEAKAFSTWFDKMTMEDVKETMKTGVSQIDYLYGKKEPMAGKVPEWMEFFGRMHSAIKLLPKRAEFFRSLEMRTEHAIKNGKDVNDPMVQQEMATAAYNDALRAIFMQDNPLTDAYSRLVKSLEETNPAFASILKLTFPIVKVPTNYVAEQASYVPPIAMVKAITTLYKGREGMTPEQADYFMRAMKKGAIGTAFIFMGFMNPQAIGGYYTGKRKKDELEAGDIELFGTKLPHFMLHTPLLEMLQIGATMRRAQDAKLAKGEEPSKFDGIPTVFKGISQQIPFVGTGERISRAMESKGDALNQYGYSLGKSILEPQLMQNIADWTDMKEGEVVKRKTGTFGESLKEGIPGLRSGLKEDVSKYSKKEYQEFSDFSERGLNIPELNKRTTYKVKIDDAHPEGIMTESEYETFVNKTKEYEKESYRMFNERHKDDLEELKRMQAIKDMSPSDKAEMNKLKEKLQNKLESLHDKAIKKAKKEIQE